MSGTITRVASADLPEHELIQRAQQGEPAAFEALVARHAPFVYNLALRTLGDPHEAEDLAQEAFVRVWRALPQFRADARFSTWLYRIVVNLCYNRLPRMKAALAEIDIEGEAHLPDDRRPVDAGVLSGELRAHLHAAIGALPEGYRMLITMRHLQDMSYGDIATATGMPLGTVKTGIHRARRQLQTAIEIYEAGGAPLSTGMNAPRPGRDSSPPGHRTAGPHPRPDQGTSAISAIGEPILDRSRLEAIHA